VFGRATIRLGIGPHSSLVCIIMSLGDSSGELMLVERENSVSLPL